MADGTLSMAEGLGLKTLDSNELRRKQVPHMESPNNGIPFTLNPQRSSNSGLEVSKGKQEDDLTLNVSHNALSTSPTSTKYTTIIPQAGIANPEDELEKELVRIVSSSQETLLLPQLDIPNPQLYATSHQPAISNITSDKTC
ncbi:hypothetical protein RHGRI_020833 [Rhododendron griersonianum]|uniref:Uncharacterized protein n=1 Tax=Rhododendron griersonianum TaxID=479676 RepID=A0AAV6JHP6_9ERIC|nr:hypothetical protein RHGRI_020833 [Rhododendron griersonianum]